MFARGAWFFLPAIRCICVLSALFPLAPTVEAQAARRAAYSPAHGLAQEGFAQEDFRQTVRKSGLIFEGTVTSIQREFGTGNIPQTYRISFQVKQGLRGVQTGATLSIREWAGLWNGLGTGLGAGPSQAARYRVGERALLFLYPASRAGLTSPVGGTKGKLAVNRAGQVALPVEWTGILGPAGSAPSGTTSRSSFQANWVPLSQLLQRVQQRKGE